MNDNKIVIVVDAKAQPKQRPQFNSRTKRAFTPKRTLDYESMVGKVAKQAMSQRHFLRFSQKVPLKITILFIYAPTASWSKKKKEQALNGEIYPIASNIGDVDNSAKAILDAMNGIVYEDDKSIVEMSAKKKYGTKDHIIIIVEEVKE